ncbi:protein neprosin-like [Silene latifolia]|uniref:protein neprosin-like n=1 Tax=Silene latifolia TaxID=37657 RepID=UPI003D77B433
MVLETIRRVLSVCFLVSILAAKGHSRIHGSKYAGKTVKNEYGDTYDCIDFYKQPAFDHPLLKNHSFHPQMRPTFQPQTIRNNDISWEINATATDIPLLKDGGCPQGTIPVRRMNKSGGISKAKISNTTNEVISASGTMFAISQTNTNMWKFYNGVGAIMSVYNPRALASQYSSAEITLKGGTDSIVAGWTVSHLNSTCIWKFFFLSIVLILGKGAFKKVFNYSFKACPSHGPYSPGIASSLATGRIQVSLMTVP